MKKYFTDEKKMEERMEEEIGFDTIKYKVEKFLRENLALNEENAVPTLKISKEVFGEKGTRKMLNKHLYKMQSVQKVAEPDGTKPRWFLKQL